MILVCRILRGGASGAEGHHLTLPALVRGSDSQDNGGGTPGLRLVSQIKAKESVLCGVTTPEGRSCVEALNLCIGGVGT